MTTRLDKDENGLVTQVVSDEKVLDPESDLAVQVPENLSERNALDREEPVDSPEDLAKSVYGEDSAEAKAAAGADEAEDEESDADAAADADSE